MENISGCIGAAFANLYEGKSTNIEQNCPERPERNQTNAYGDGDCRTETNSENTEKPNYCELKTVKDQLKSKSDNAMASHGNQSALDSKLNSNEHGTTSFSELGKTNQNQRMINFEGGDGAFHTINEQNTTDAKKPNLEPSTRRLPKSTGRTKRSLAVVKQKIDLNSIPMAAKFTAELIQEISKIAEIENNGECCIPATQLSYRTPGATPLNKQGRIKRPMNAFMCWARTARTYLCQQIPHASNADVSVKLGELWCLMSEDQKRPYFEQSLRIKQKHREEFPDWVYKPQSRKQRSGSDVEKSSHDNCFDSLDCFPDLYDKPSPHASRSVILLDQDGAASDDMVPEASHEIEVLAQGTKVYDELEVPIYNSGTPRQAVVPAKRQLIGGIFCNLPPSGYRNNNRRTANTRANRGNIATTAQGPNLESNKPVKQGKRPYVRKKPLYSEASDDAFPFKKITRKGQGKKRGPYAKKAKVMEYHSTIPPPPGPARSLCSMENFSNSFRNNTEVDQREEPEIEILNATWKGGVVQERQNEIEVYDLTIDDDDTSIVFDGISEGLVTVNTNKNTDNSSDSDNVRNESCASQPLPANNSPEDNSTAIDKTRADTSNSKNIHCTDTDRAFHYCTEESQVRANITYRSKEEELSSNTSSGALLVLSSFARRVCEQISGDDETNIQNRTENDGYTCLSLSEDSNASTGPLVIDTDKSEDFNDSNDEDDDEILYTDITNLVKPVVKAIKAPNNKNSSFQPLNESCGRKIPTGLDVVSKLKPLFMEGNKISSLGNTYFNNLSLTGNSSIIPTQVAENCIPIQMQPCGTDQCNKIQSTNNIESVVDCQDPHVVLGVPSNTQPTDSVTTCKTSAENIILPLEKSWEHSPSKTLLQQTHLNSNVTDYPTVPSKQQPSILPYSDSVLRKDDIPPKPKQPNLYSRSFGPFAVRSVYPPPSCSQKNMPFDDQPSTYSKLPTVGTSKVNFPNSKSSIEMKMHPTVAQDHGHTVTKVTLESRVFHNMDNKDKTDVISPYTQVKSVLHSTTEVFEIDNNSSNINDLTPVDSGECIKSTDSSMASMDDSSKNINKNTQGQSETFEVHQKEIDHDPKSPSISASTIQAAISMAENMTQKILVETEPYQINTIQCDGKPVAVEIYRANPMKSDASAGPIKFYKTCSVQTDTNSVSSVETDSSIIKNPNNSETLVEATTKYAGNLVPNPMANDTNKIKPLYTSITTEGTASKPKIRYFDLPRLPLTVPNSIAFEAQRHRFNERRASRSESALKGKAEGKLFYKDSNAHLSRSTQLSSGQAKVSYSENEIIAKWYGYDDARLADSQKPVNTGYENQTNASISTEFYSHANNLSEQNLPVTNSLNSNAPHEIANNYLHADTNLPSIGNLEPEALPTNVPYIMSSSKQFSSPVDQNHSPQSNNIAMSDQDINPGKSPSMTSATLSTDQKSVESYQFSPSNSTLETVSGKKQPATATLKRTSSVNTNRLTNSNKKSKRSSSHSTQQSSNNMKQNATMHQQRPYGYHNFDSIYQIPEEVRQQLSSYSYLPLMHYDIMNEITSTNGNNVPFAKNCKVKPNSTASPLLPPEPFPRSRKTPRIRPISDKRQYLPAGAPFNTPTISERLSVDKKTSGAYHDAQGTQNTQQQRNTGKHADRNTPSSRRNKINVMEKLSNSVYKLFTNLFPVSTPFTNLANDIYDEQNLATCGKWPTAPNNVPCRCTYCSYYEPVNNEIVSLGTNYILAGDNITIFPPLQTMPVPGSYIQRLQKQANCILRHYFCAFTTASLFHKFISDITTMVFRYFIRHFGPLSCDAQFAKVIDDLCLYADSFFTRHFGSPPNTSQFAKFVEEMDRVSYITLSKQYTDLQAAILPSQFETFPPPVSKPTFTESSNTGTSASAYQPMGTLNDLAADFYQQNPNGLGPWPWNESSFGHLHMPCQAGCVHLPHPNAVPYNQHPEQTSSIPQTSLEPPATKRPKISKPTRYSNLSSLSETEQNTYKPASQIDFYSISGNTNDTPNECNSPGNLVIDMDRKTDD